MFGHPAWVPNLANEACVWARQTHASFAMFGGPAWIPNIGNEACVWARISEERSQTSETKRVLTLRGKDVEERISEEEISEEERISEDRRSEETVSEESRGEALRGEDFLPGWEIWAGKR